ncbi:MAG: acyltransferase family protein [Planctomycetota bacterium]
MTHAPTTIPYRKDIDGLRAIAILPVVLFHSGFGCSGGFVGVDVFFVISGYLITGILLRELDTGTFSLARFWQRRVRRLFPVLMVVLLLTMAAGWALLLPSEFALLGEHSLATLVSAANFRLQVTAGYWAPQAENLPLLHMWSLAVEEQFYLLLPLLLALGHRFLKQRLGMALGLACAFSLVYCLRSHEEHSKSTFFLLPGRAWELLLGSVTSWWVQRGFRMREYLAPFAAWLGLGMILVPAFALKRDVTWPGPLALLPTVGTMLLIVANAHSTSASRILSLSPLRFVGLISYSLYLWHWPILVFTRIYRYPEPPTRWDLVLAITAAVALSALTWRFVEHPFRYKASVSQRDNKRFFAAIFVVWAGVGLMSHAVYWTNGFHELFYRRLPESAQIVKRRPARESFRRYNAAAVLEQGGVKFCCEDRTPRIVVLGSSHGMMLGSVFEHLSATHRVPLAMFTWNGSPGLFAGNNTYVTVGGSSNLEKRRRDDLVKRFIAEWKPAFVVIAGRWDLEATSAWAAETEASFTEFQQAVHGTVEWLSNHTAKIVIVGQVPLLPLPNDDIARDILVRYRRDEYRLPRFVERPDDAARRRRASAFFATWSNAELKFIEPEGLFLHPDGAIRYHNDEVVLYQDDDHLNHFGALEMRNLLAAIFTEAKAALETASEATNPTGR